MSSVSNHFTEGLQLNPKTAQVLGRFDRRRRLLLLVRGIASAVVVFLVAMSVIALVDYLWLLSDSLRWALSGIAYGLTAATAWWFGIRPMGHSNARLVARQLESTDSGLREDLLSAVELADPQSANGSPRFRQWLQDSVAQRAAGLDVSRLLPVGLVQRWLLAGLLLAVVFAGLFMIPKMQFGRRIARAMLPGIQIQRASLTEVSILQPSPPSGYVAEGDAVAVVARIGGRMTDDVSIQWRNADGIAGETPMTPRVAAASANAGATLEVQDLFAANLSIGTAELEYRIVAGDAITLWHQLTPLPRPRVQSFRKQYEFPNYAGLSDRVEEAEHGDLKALVGSKATITVRFDEPVEDATIRFGNGGTAIKLQASESSDHEFLATIPIRTPGTYQIDATSRRSGLNNPFSPQYSITPVVDSAPIAQWSEETPRMMIVSPLDVINLKASASDDLPIDRVIQEFQLNGEVAMIRELEVSEPARDLTLAWGWDLLRRTDDKLESVKLANGDFIRTRVVAIDRNSQRGESAILELLIADEGFDSNRHARLEELRQLTAQTSVWSIRMNRWMDSMQQQAQQPDESLIAENVDEAAAIRKEGEAILQRLEQIIAGSPNLAEAGSLELIGRAVSDLTEEQSHWLAGFLQALDETNEQWQPTRQNLLRDHANQAKQYANDATRLEQYAKHVLGERLTTGLLGDAISLRESLQPMLTADSPLPIERFPRYLVVTVGRMQEINRIIEQHAKEIPESTLRHFDNWDQWSDSWTARLQAAIEDRPGEDAMRALVKQFDAELKNQVDNRMIDGRMASTVHSLLRDLQNQVGATSDVVRTMARQGQQAEKASQEQKGQLDSDASARSHRDLAYAEAGFVRARDQLLARLQNKESLHRSRPNVDLQFAADTKLMQRAIENVSQEGYQPYREEPAQAVYDNLAKAYQTLEAKHEADQWLEELQQLMLAERRLDGTAINKVQHPSWLERFSTGLEWPVRNLRTVGMPPEAVNQIDHARYHDHFNQARNRITSRRWSGEPMLTAESSLESLQAHLSSALQALDPQVIEARATLQRYVLSLSEQARAAAEQAEQAQQRTASRPDSEASTTEQLAEQQQEVEQSTRQTLESLVDLANTASLTDPEERELARDADIAAAQIQQAARRAEQSMNRASDAQTEQQRSESLDETAQALDELAQALEQTADHFEKAERGEDLAQSRQQLRQSEDSLQQQGELDQRYERAESLAEAAQRSPEEMLRELENELQQNEPMQQELSDIARRAAEAAQRTLDQAAKEEKALIQSLERSDPSFQERKFRAAREIADLAERAAAVDQSLMQATERAIGWANTPEARPDLDQTRQQLREAINRANQMGGDQAPLNQMQQTAGEMSQAIEAASNSLQRLREQSGEAQEENIHSDESSRRRTQDQVDRFARDARSQQLRAASTAQRQWAAAEQQANRRIQEAQRQKRDAENQQRQLQQRMDREPNAQEQLKAEIAAAQDRIDRADQAEQAARETKQFTEQRAAQARDRENEIKNQPIDALDKPNPAAQLAVQMSEQAEQELTKIQDALGQLSQDMNFADQLQSPQSTLQQVAGQQERLEQNVGEAAEQLRRAARHEQRLGQQQLAEQLNAAAQAVAENAATAAQQATESLQQASSQPQASPEANQRVAEAAEQIRQAADQLAQMLQTSLPDTAESVAAQTSEMTAQQQRGEQLAQTLDELDRQLASSQQQGDQSGQQAGDDSPGQSPPGQTPSGQSPTAQQASPTLANAVDAQSQQAARQRQQQLDPSRGQQGQQGEPSSQTASSSSATEPGSGEMPGGGRLDTSGIDRMGSDWGQLRERKTDDVTEGRSATVASQYRREVEAYFRAIARRAAEKQAANQQE